MVLLPYLFSAVSILKEAAATDCIVLLVSRDSQSQSDFKRLSSDIVKTATPHQNGMSDIHLYMYVCIYSGTSK